MTTEEVGTVSSARTPVDWAEGLPVPDYLTLRQGTRPIVIVAPHGGRRQRPIRRGDGVNDLETAAIAWELAERLDAHAIVNHGLDRNEIDLNRITHLTDRAPQVLALLSGAIDAASRGGRVPLVLFVHGWNMVVPCCDVGIGVRRRAGEITGRFPTLSRARFDSTIAAMEEELAQRGVGASIGRRYTASGRDNAAQLFSGRHAEHENATVAALSRLAIDERVDAAQLELGIPLRWEGRLRDAMIEGLVAALSREAESGGAAAAGSDDAGAASSPGRAASGVSSNETIAIVPRVSGGWEIDARPRDAAVGPAEPAYSLQAVLDPEAGIATFCGVESTGPRSMSARFSLVFTDGSMMLLVGEGEWSGEPGHYQLEGFDWRATQDGARIEVRLRAPMIRYPTHDAYLDLEQGLAGSRLEDADVHLVAEALSPEHARLRGRVSTLGKSWDINTIAFLDRAGRRMTSVESRIRVLVARSTEDVVVARNGTEAGSLLRMDDRAGSLGVIRRAPEMQEAIVLHDAEILARVPVWRPLSEGAFVRWQFGIVRCRYTDGGPESMGLFECTDVFGVPEPAPSVEDEALGSADSVQTSEE
jgi:hypothetical protein